MKELAGAIAAFALLAGSAAAQDRIELEPASSWVMNYDDDSCALQRQFGPEGQQVFLEMRQFAPREELQVTTASKDFALRRGDFSVRVEPIDSVPRPIAGLFNIALGEGYTGRLFPLSLTAGEAEYDELYSHFVDTTPVLFDEQRKLLYEGKDLWGKAASAQGRARERAFRDFQRLTTRDDYQAASRRAARAFRQTKSYQDYFARLAAEVTGIGFYDAFDRPVYLRTGGLQDAMEAMNRCLDELVAHWGIDVEAHRTLTRAVEPQDYDKLVREVMEDYPREMARRRIPAYVRVRLDVSAEGMPTGCHMQSAINDESFERKACGNMMRFARFYPALDAQGSAIRSYYQLSVVYSPR
jgi:hypothetical protein